MADEKAKIVTDATGPSSGPAPAQPEVDAQVSKQEQSAPEAPTPDKAEAPAQEAPAQDKAADAPKEQKAASVSVFNFRCGVCFLHREVRHLDPDGPGHAEYLYCIRPA